METKKKTVKLFFLQLNCLKILKHFQKCLSLTFKHYTYISEVKEKNKGFFYSGSHYIYIHYNTIQFSILVLTIYTLQYNLVFYSGSHYIYITIQSSFLFWFSLYIYITIQSSFLFWFSLYIHIQYNLVCHYCFKI